jgi:hypothetical protein
MGVVTGDDNQTSDDRYLSDVLLLCVTCQQPIKARINTAQWIRVEWISPDGDCQACNQKAKEAQVEEGRTTANQRRT